MANRNLQGEMNRCMPIAQDVGLGDLLQELVDSNNELRTQHNALLSKLDADAGVTDADYAATLTVATELADVNDRG